MNDCDMGLDCPVQCGPILNMSLGSILMLRWKKELPLGYSNHLNSVCKRSSLDTSRRVLVRDLKLVEHWIKNTVALEWGSSLVRLGV